MLKIQKILVPKKSFKKSLKIQKICVKNTKNFSVKNNNNIKPAVQENHLGDQILYRIPGNPKKRRHGHNFTRLEGY